MIDLEFWKKHVARRNDVAHKNSNWGGLVVNRVCRYWHYDVAEMMRAEEMPKEEIDAWLSEMETITLNEIAARSVQNGESNGHHNGV